jgi:predicted ATPase with chaperone activity
MAGSPGPGKTLLARALPGILPEMSIEVPHVDYEKRSAARMGGSSESIRVQGDQAARDIQSKRFSKNGSSLLE